MAGEGFFTFFFNKEIIYSILLVPGSSSGNPLSYRNHDNLKTNTKNGIFYNLRFKFKF